MSSVYGPEPKRNTTLSGLDRDFRVRVEEVLNNLKDGGFDPVIFETFRSGSRQTWLYGIGRTHHRNREPRTWTMQSRHQSGHACDVISKVWGWDSRKFFDALAAECRLEGLETLPHDRCHIQENLGL